MITLVWIFGSIAAYLAIGYAVAMWDRPHLYDRLQDTSSADRARRYPGVYAESVRSEVRSLVRVTSTATLLLWPLRLPYLLMANAVDKRDPDMLARKVREQEQEIRDRDEKIRELERELG